MTLIHHAAISLLLAGVMASPAQAAEPSPDKLRQFDKVIAPLLASRCLDCHNATDKKGGLNLAAKAGMLAGGESGPAIVPGNADQSLVWQRVASDEMPPKKPLTADEKNLLRAWIDAGAHWGSDPIQRLRFSTPGRAGYDWWAFRPIAQVSPPKVRDAAWPRGPLDHFVLAALEQKGLTPAPPADRRTWLRRVTFDLTGLPPEPRDVADFLADDSASAFETVVDRLLASPHYGERWARHWLDVVRFAESDGFERDQLRDHAWRYRDWVIAAFNDDLPYDEFVRQQLAGDVLKPDDPRAVIATGYLVAAPRDRVGETQQSAAMKAVVAADAMEDLVGVSGQTFLGLTVHCARCHDHKFDPVSQVEYYQMAAALAGVRHGDRESLSPAGRTAAASLMSEIAMQRSRSEAELAAIDEPARLRILGHHDRVIGEDEILALLDKSQRDKRHNLMKELSLARMRERLLQGGMTYAVAPEQPKTMHVQLRGNPAQPGEVVAPGGIEACGAPFKFGLGSDAPENQRRVKLAEWITDPANPLPARVIVNRLWHYHFGQGLVDTPNDFGINGARPTHPELLDWLASELVRGGWSLKSLHRTIVLSATYRQSGRVLPEGHKLDADNRLLWRKIPLRLEAEEVRDAILVLAGQWNPAIGGPGFRDFTTYVRNSQFYNPIDPVGYAYQRRSIYRTWVRSGTSRFLDVLDCPDPSTVTPKRAVTTTPLQALALLNNAFVLRMSERMAERLEATSPQLDERIQSAYEWAYARPAEERELAGATELVKIHGLAALCRAIFNSNEFLYVD